jgi:ABC-type antimicrobial peptide transport system permease subunit
MVMIVRERKREVGILKAIGGSNRRIMCQFMTEALTFSVLGGAVGLLAGALAAGSITSSLVGNSGSSSSSANQLTVQNPALEHLSQVHATAGAPDILVGLAGRHPPDRRVRECGRDLSHQQNPTSRSPKE